MCSARCERRVLGELTGEVASKKTDLDLEDAPVADSVAEDRVSHLVIHAPLVCAEELGAADRGQSHSAAATDEVVCLNHAGVDRSHHGGIDDEWPKLLHDIEGEGGTTIARLMVEAEVRIETDAGKGDGDVFGQQGVAERQQGVHWVSRRPPVPPLEVEGQASK